MYKIQQANKEMVAAVNADTDRRFRLAEIACAADLNRLGIKATGSKIDIHVLEKAMTDRGLQPVERIRIKSALAAIGWID
jgi:hypothetical protein